MSVIIRLQGLPWSASALDIRNFFKGLSIPAGGVHIIGGEKGDAFIAFSTDEDARQGMNKNFEMLSDSVIKLFLSSKTEMQNVIEQARAPIANSSPTVPEQSSKVPDPHGRPLDNDIYGGEPLSRNSSWGGAPKVEFQRQDPANVFKEPQSWYDGQQQADLQKYPRNDVYPDPGNYNYGQQDAGLNHPDADMIPKDSRAMPPEMRPSRPVGEPFAGGLKNEFRGPASMKPIDEPFPLDGRNKNWQGDYDPVSRGPREDMNYPPDIRNPQSARYEPSDGKFDSVRSQRDSFDPWSQNVQGPEEPDDIPQFDEYGRQIFPTEQRPFSQKPVGPTFKSNERPGAGFLPARNVPEVFEPGFKKGSQFPDDPDLRKETLMPPRGLTTGPKFGNEFPDDRDFRNTPRERQIFSRLDDKPDYLQDGTPRNPNLTNRPNVSERMSNSPASFSGMNQDQRSGYPQNQGAFPQADHFDPMNQGSSLNVPHGPRGPFRQDIMGARPEGPGGRFGPGEPRGRFPPDGPRHHFEGPVDRYPPEHVGEEFPPDVSGERFPPDRLRERFPPDGSGDRYALEGPMRRFGPEVRGGAYPADGPGGRMPPERLGRGRLGADGPHSRMPHEGIGGNFQPEGQGDIDSPPGPAGRIPMQGGVRNPPFAGPGGRFPPEGSRGRGRPGGPFRGPVPLLDVPTIGSDIQETDVERPGFPHIAGNVPKLQDSNALVKDNQQNLDKWKDGRQPYGDKSLKPENGQPVSKPAVPGKGLLGDAPPLAKPMPEDKDNRDLADRDNRHMGRPMPSRGSDDGHFGGGYGRRGNPDSARFSSRDIYRERDDRSRSRGRNEDRDYDRRGDSYYRSDRRDDHYRSSRYSDRDSRSYSERDRDRDQSRRDRDSRSDQSKSGSERDRESRSSQSKSSADKDSRGDSKGSSDKDSRTDSRGSKRIRSEDIRGSYHVVLHSMSSDVSYREVRRFFAPIEIPFDGLKLINDEQGRRTGQGYIKFASDMDVVNALKKAGTNMNGKKVQIQRCTKEDYETAVDSYIPDTDSPPMPQKRPKLNEPDSTKEQPQISTSPPFMAALKGLPPKITKQDIVQFLLGINIANGGDAVYIDIDQKGIGTGTVYVEVSTHEDLKKVFACECRTMGPRLIRVSQAKKEDIDAVLDHQKKFSHFESNLGDVDNRKLEFGKNDQSVLGKPPSDNEAKRIGKNDADSRVQEDSYFVCLNGLPPLCTQREIREFCQGLSIAPRGLQICHDGDGKPTGEAFLEFHSKEHHEGCLQLDKHNMGHNQISVVGVTKVEMVTRMRQARLVSKFGPTARNPLQSGGPPLIADTPDAPANDCTKSIPPGVLKRHWFYLRCSNLPLSVTIREILGFFQGHSPVPESIRLHYTGDGHPTGNAVVGFESRDEAMKAMHELNNALCRQNNVVINPASY
ncbi:uncharacterized protein LOC121388625 [Gigantopelta aegis]|uniref:uncharacterized protein LOC121388625 n=1 Tax=Gigantopelta aegis TaxID=1735272 RepID=UPI001B887556|nr:uncharacterized protein LOC121388625 [Gigantopelta aegis]XP_041375980.1 uncharacterized protein LOC121388625 [Gigantopelta aegis]XP_041375981.1 uncharacterized protein LOC121388625 [Gigantopelta aegis]